MPIKNRYNGEWLRPVAPHYLASKAERARALVNIMTNDHVHPKSRDDYLTRYRKEKMFLSYPKIVEVPSTLRKDLGWVKRSVLVKPHTCDDAAYQRRMVRPRVPTRLANGVIVITTVNFDDETPWAEVYVAPSVDAFITHNHFGDKSSIRRYELAPGDVIPGLEQSWCLSDEINLADDPWGPTGDSYLILTHSW